MRALGFVLAVLAAPVLAAPAAQEVRAQDVVNDYPTETRAEYVFACMQTNGATRDALSRCSCSIDAIATILPYDAYVSAETVLSMRHGGGGERMALFRGTPTTTAAVADLRRAQAEAEMLCF
jgi:hypothetical protein